MGETGDLVGMQHEDERRLARVQKWVADIKRLMDEGDVIHKAVSLDFVVTMAQMVATPANQYAVRHLDKEMDVRQASHLASIFATMCASTAFILHAIEYDKWNWKFRDTGDTFDHETMVGDTFACVRHCHEVVNQKFSEDDSVLTSAWRDAVTAMAELSPEENEEWTTLYDSSTRVATTGRNGR